MSRLLMTANESKHVLLTGASRGIGVHIAQALAREGCRLSLVARNTEGLTATAEKVRRAGGEVAVIGADLMDRADRTRAVKAAEEAFGPIDVLVNNAGVYQPGLLESRDDASIESELQVNLHALIYLSKAVLPSMRQRGKGVIVNMSSLAGLVGAAYSEVYSATKFGVIGFTRALRATLAQEGEHNIRVVSVCPGYVSEVGMFEDYAQQFQLEPPAWIGTSHPDAVAQAVIDATRSNSPELIVNPGPIRLGLGIGTLFPRLMEWLYLKLGAHGTLSPVLQKENRASLGSGEKERGHG